MMEERIESLCKRAKKCVGRVGAAIGSFRAAKLGLTS